MNPKAKKALKIVGFSILGLAIIGGGIYLYIRWKNKWDGTDENPHVTNNYNANISNSGGGTSAPNPYAKYSKEDVKKMQTWLYWKGALSLNQTIMDAISTTGGIDGIIGTGFKTALNEAIKQGYVKSIEDLYSKAK